ncbi:RNA helicase [Coniosporium apollinis]|uniref:RNA helicase n=1 Tax=Coniosporium apollinis TaxID=61459 RepID=A0ABQ9P7V1_9PEZI|nr:RNA helicase [Coniosporium apollinis]
MQRRKWIPGQCIFCAFRSQTWLPRRQLRPRAADFSTSASLRAYRKLQLTKLDLPENPRSVIRPLFLDPEKRRRDAGFKRNLLLDIEDPQKKSLARRRGEISLKGRAQGRAGRVTVRGMKNLILERLEALEEELRHSELRQTLQVDDVSFGKLYGAFRRQIAESITYASIASPEDEEQPLFTSLMDTFIKRGQDELDAQLRHICYGHLVGSKFTKTDIENQKALADLRYPTEWFPRARTMQRQIHVHVGPTNSGKTYHALKRLEQAESGCYAGPLRLLAHEVFTRLNAKGKRCALITGEERRYPDEETDLPFMSSCTVEMVPLGADLDVAVIDEIQMLGSEERGWAWTQAFLGLQAKEVHLCGEERTVPLIKQLAAMTGDKVEIHHYKRLSPLQMSSESLKGKLGKLQKGDCIVVFSVMGIHAMRKEIERATGKKVAIVYGSLPPETRAQQARLFNDPNNDYDFLVASDAIGMGLNLSIKRVIFESAQKNNGYQMVTLKTADIKQIAGRAGRYRTAAQATEPAQAPPIVDVDDGASPTREPAVDTANPPAPLPPTDNTNIGYVTTLEDFDYPTVAKAMLSEAEPIRTAGIIPPASIIERFSSYFPPGTPFSYILLRLSEISQTSGRFHMCGLRDQLAIADTIQPVKGLTTVDRIIFCAAPASKRDKGMHKLLRALAECVAEQRAGSLLDIAEFNLEVLDQEPDPSRRYLSELETLHKGLVLYLWLSYRFSGVFTTRALCFHVKELVENKIEECLRNFAFTPELRQKIRAKRERQIVEALQENFAMDEEDAAGMAKQAYYKGTLNFKPTTVADSDAGLEGTATNEGVEEEERQVGEPALDRESLSEEVARMLQDKDVDLMEDGVEAEETDEDQTPEFEEVSEEAQAIEASAQEETAGEAAEDVSPGAPLIRRVHGGTPLSMEQSVRQLVDGERGPNLQNEADTNATPTTPI